MGNKSNKINLYKSVKLNEWLRTITMIIYRQFKLSLHDITYYFPLAVNSVLESH